MQENIPASYRGPVLIHDVRVCPFDIDIVLSARPSISCGMSVLSAAVGLAFMMRGISHLHGKKILGIPPLSRANHHRYCFMALPARHLRFRKCQSPGLFRGRGSSRSLGCCARVLRRLVSFVCVETIICFTFVCFPLMFVLLFSLFYFLLVSCLCSCYLLYVCLFSVGVYARVFAWFVSCSW